MLTTLESRKRIGQTNKVNLQQLVLWWRKVSKMVWAMVNSIRWCFFFAIILAFDKDQIDCCRAPIGKNDGISRVRTADLRRVKAKSLRFPLRLKNNKTVVNPTANLIQGKILSYKLTEPLRWKAQRRIDEPLFRFVPSNDAFVYQVGVLTLQRIHIKFCALAVFMELDFRLC